MAKINTPPDELFSLIQSSLTYEAYASIISLESDFLFEIGHTSSHKKPKNI